MPNNKGKRRRFGSVRRRRSGSSRAATSVPTGKRHFAPHRFKRERDAHRGVQLGNLTTAIVRQWRADLRTKRNVSETVTAKAYRLLRAVLNTVVDDHRILLTNPCRIKGADRETRAERPVLSVAQAFAPADAMPDRRFQVLVLLTAFASLRWGEVTALRRQDASDGSSVRVAFAHTEVKGKGLVVGPPKARAGIRTVAVPAAVRADLLAHLFAA
jgi:hypothetical protein